MSDERPIHTFDIDMSDGSFKVQPKTEVFAVREESPRGTLYHGPYLTENEAEDSAAAIPGPFFRTVITLAL